MATACVTSRSVSAPSSWKPVITLTTAATTSPPTFQGLSLRWSDEFDGMAGRSPDASKWGYDVGGGGWGNGELQTYTSSSANAQLDGAGHLRLLARRKPGSALSAQGAYTSARLVTRNRFAVKYGVVRARIKVPLGQGLLPAFWMLGTSITKVGWPRSGEVDIVETMNASDVDNASIHGPMTGAKGRSWHLGGTKRTSRSLADAFHVYSAELEPGRITLRLDGAVVFRLLRSDLRPGQAWVFDQPFYLLMNLAVGGQWPGSPDRFTNFPTSMVVDWVRVYQ